MEDSTKTKRIHELRRLVAYHRERYHTDDAPEISDAAYDSLVRELAQLEDQTGERSGEVDVVGGSVSAAFSKVTHPVRQWSFDNIFSQSELTEWTARAHRMLAQEDVNPDRVSYVVEHKIDGLKLVLHYEAGQLVRALTRGDGVVGENVTHTAKTIRTIPETLSKPVSLLCVGEVWLSDAEFKRINAARQDAGEPLFANPRNAAAGSIRQLDPAVATERNLSIHVYDIDQLTVHDTGVAVPETQWAELELLSTLGLPTNPHSALLHTVEEIQSYYDQWVQTHSSLEYGVDGVVIKINEIPYQRLLGYTAKSPRYGIAYKFPAEQSTTVIEDIVLQIGRTGVITPVAIVTPTVIDGSTVSRATLHNEDFIAEKDVRIGDTVIIQKAGDIIPEIVSVMLDLRPEDTQAYVFPSVVDGCGGDGSIERIPGEAAYRCVSLDADHIRRLQLYHFVSKACFNIDGVGPKIIDALLDAGLITDAVDLFTLTHEDFLTLPAFKERAATNALQAIASARSVTLPRFLFALSIPFVGAETAQILTRHFGSLPAIQNASLSDLCAVYGIGNTVATSISEWMSLPEHRQLIDRLQTHVSIESAEPVSSSLGGKTFVLTGTLQHYTRDQAKDMIRARGGTIASSVSKKTDFVVVGTEPGSKAAQAQALGVTILDEAAFRSYIGSA